MYAGRQAEIGTVDEIFYEPKHPYTKGLLASLPRLDRRYDNQRLAPDQGAAAVADLPAAGCSFHPRCPYADLDGPCATVRPELIDLGGGHRSACHFAKTLDERVPADDL